MGVYDPLSARRAAHAGFEAVFVSGRSVAQAAFAVELPYVRAVDAAPYVAYVRLLCSATNVPVIADAEDGLGDPIATCSALERAGAAAVQLQDVLESGEVLTTRAMCETVRAVRASTGLVVVARTDVLANDRPDALARMRAYRDAGAELVMAGLTPVAEEVHLGSKLLRQLADAARGALVVFTPDGRRLLPLHALPDEVKVVLLTAAVVDHATRAVDETLRHLLDLAGNRSA
ncbi:MAG: hypothetical protein ABS81_05980 [Pseudonocardia sp. SCN 72-86]|nr:MAG: hypothetical protein ABS81_05980 [Pseudonocardia sp. SCN 72-86]